jgi:hypothetical protein
MTKITFGDWFKHVVLLVLVPYDHHGCRRCEKVTTRMKERLHGIPPPPSEIPLPPVPSDDQILSAIGAWMLCCAVGAYNRTLSTSGHLDFESWYSICDWQPPLAKKLGIGESRLRNVLLDYAKRNAHRSYIEVLETENALRPDRKLELREKGLEVPRKEVRP